MPFDMGFNVRSTSGYVTDPSYCVPVINESYPHTYTNADGKSVNGGWDTVPSTRQDEVSGNDPRIAGSHLELDFNTLPVRTFTVDLSSGSAPGAGDYGIDLACGNTANYLSVKTLVKDNTTTLIDLTNGGPGLGTEPGKFRDATAALITASTTWTGTPVTKTFESTTATISIHATNNDSFVNSPIAHFRLTLATVAAASLLPPPNRFAHMLVR